MAMSAAAIINDVAIAISGSNSSMLISLWVFLSGCAFIIAAIIIIPRVFKWIEQRCNEGESINDTYICIALTLLLACWNPCHVWCFCGWCFDSKGRTFGRNPNGESLYFVASGLKTNVATIQGLQSWGLLILLIFTACFGKIVGTFAVSIALKVPKRETLALGFLMNTKGLVELIVLNIGKERKVLFEVKKRASMDESIKFEEKCVNAAADVICAVEEVRRSSIFLVGRVPEGEIAVALREKIEWPELGPIGNLSISPESMTQGSVLVVQQYRETPDVDLAAVCTSSSSPEK